MRKLVSMLLIMLVAFGVVFATEPEEPEGDISGGASMDRSTPDHIYLKAKVPEGSGIDDDLTGGEDPDPDKNGGLYVLVGIPRDESKSFGSNDTYTKGDLVGLQNFALKETAKEVTLVPENAGDTEGSVVIYYAAAAKIAETVRSFTYKVSSQKGFTLVNGDETVAQIDVDNKVVTSSLDGISAEASQDAVTITGEAGGNHTDYVYMAKTILSWEKSADYAAGDYVAEISIAIDAV